MTNLEDGMDFVSIHGVQNGQSALVDRAKEQFNVDLRPGTDQISDLNINVIDPDLQNVPSSNRAAVPLDDFFPGNMTYTTKNAGMEFVHQLKQSNTPGTQGSIWDKDLVVCAGQYTEGEQFQREDGVPFSGSFGMGFICVDCQTGKKFFMKQMPLRNFQHSEVLIPNQVDCANVVKQFGVIQQVDEHRINKIQIMMEYAGITLTHFVKQRGGLDLELIWNFMKQILFGLNELDKRGIVHHDIKPDNMCICSDSNGSYKPVITDFGSARFRRQPLDPKNWTPAYLAPEAWRQVREKFEHSQNSLEKLPLDNRITGKVDIYASALTVLFMFQGQHVLNPQNNISNHVLAHRCENAKEHIPKECPKEMQTLLIQILSTSPDKRISAHGALDYIGCVQRKPLKLTLNGNPVCSPSENTFDHMIINLEGQKKPQKRRPLKVPPEAIKPAKCPHDDPHHHDGPSFKKRRPDDVTVLSKCLENFHI